MTYNVYQQSISIQPEIEGISLIASIDYDLFVDSDIHVSPIQLTLRATRPIYGLTNTPSKIVVGSGSINEISGDGHSYNIEWTPPNGSGSTTLTLKKDAANSDEGKTPTRDQTFTINYSNIGDATAIVSVGADSECVLTLDATARNTIFRPEDQNLGLISDVMESIYHDGYVYAVIQLQKYGTYEAAANNQTNYSRVYVPQRFGMSYLHQSGAALIRCNVQSCVWQLVKYYDFVSLAARSLCVHNDRVYFFEGSHYNAYNEGLITQRRDRNSDMVVVVADRLRVAAAVDVGADDSNKWYLAGTNKIAIQFGEDNDNLNKIKDLKEDNLILITSGSSRAFFKVESVDVPNRSILRATIEYSGLTGALPAVGAGNNWYIYTNVQEAYRINRLQLVAEDWKTQAGHVRSIANNQQEPMDHGVSHIALTADNYFDQFPKYHTDNIVDGEPVYFQDNFVGVHLGTSAAMVSDGDKLHLFSGYGNLDKIDDLESAAARPENWQDIIYDDAIDFRIPLLETNGKTTEAVLNDLANVTNSFYGLNYTYNPLTRENGQVFRYRPRDIVRADIAGDVSPGSRGPVSLERLNRDRLPSAGLAMINDEVIGWTSDGSQLLTITRGQHGTMDAIHFDSDTIRFIDHVFDIEGMESLVFTDEYEYLFNDITIRYGESKHVQSDDPDSVNSNGSKPLERSLILGSDQDVLADWLLQNTLAYFKDLKKSVLIRTDLMVSSEPNYAKMIHNGDAVLLRETERSALVGVFQILEMRHDIENRTSRFRLITT